MADDSQPVQAVLPAFVPSPRDRDSAFDTPWGPWVTIGLSMIVIAVQSIVAMIVGGVVGIVAGTQLSPEDLNEYLQNVRWNGLFVSLMLLVVTPVTVGWLLLFVVLRRGPNVTDYLGLRYVKLRQLSAWVLAAIALGIVWDLLSIILERPVVPDYMVFMQESAGFVPLLWVSLVVVAPIGDELFFRGFLFAGLTESRLGPKGAILITALGWSGLQFVLGPYTVATLFSLAMLYGIARYKTQSVIPCIAMGIAWNAYQSVLVSLYMMMNSTASAN